MQDSGIQSFFDAQAAKHPEKLYLHLNQPYYGVGDTSGSGLSDGCRDTQTRYALQFHLRRSVRPGQTFGDFEKDQTRFDGVRKLPPLADTLFLGNTPAGLYGLDAQFRRLRFLPENIVIGQNISKVRHSVTYTDKRMVVRFFSTVTNAPLSKKRKRRSICTIRTGNTWVPVRSVFRPRAPYWFPCPGIPLPAGLCRYPDFDTRGFRFPPYGLYRTAPRIVRHPVPSRRGRTGRIRHAPDRCVQGGPSGRQSCGGTGGIC